MPNTDDIVDELFSELRAAGLTVSERLGEHLRYGVMATADRPVTRLGFYTAGEMAWFAGVLPILSWSLDWIEHGRL